MRDPYWVYGGLQDNGTWGGPSMSREGAILTDFWFNFTGGDGFHTQNDPTDWRIVYSESQGGAMQRTNVETRESRSIRPGPQNILNYADFYPPAPAAPAAKAPAPATKPAATLPSGRTGEAPAGQRGGQPAAAQAQTGQRGGQASLLRFNWSTPDLSLTLQPRRRLYRRPASLPAPKTAATSG